MTPPPYPPPPCQACEGYMTPGKYFWRGTTCAQTKQLRKMRLYTQTHTSHIPHISCVPHTTHKHTYHTYTHHPYIHYTHTPHTHYCTPAISQPVAQQPLYQFWGARATVVASITAWAPEQNLPFIYKISKAFLTLT